MEAFEVQASDSERKSRESVVTFCGDRWEDWWTFQVRLARWMIHKCVPSASTSARFRKRNWRKVGSDSFDRKLKEGEQACGKESSSLVAFIVCPLTLTALAVGLLAMTRSPGAVANQHNNSKGNQARRC